MSNDFSGVVITCDTREQSAAIQNRKQPSAIVKDKFLLSEYTERELALLAESRPRIFSVYNHFSRKGAEVAIGKLDRCDYYVEGSHRDHDVNLGIEYKYITDYAGSHEDLPFKIWESTGIYESVGLFIEGKVDVEDSGNFYFVRNPAGENVLRYDLFQARLATWQNLGVHVRTFDNLNCFAPSLENLLDYITKETHKSFEYKEPCGSDLILKMLCQIPGVKIGTVSKILKDNSEMTFAELYNYDLKWYQSKVGKVTGLKLYNILHDVNYKPEVKKKKEEV